MEGPDPLIWYSKLFPYRLDLVGDYAGDEHFVLDGDSLLRHIFNDTRIDYTHGFQLLHAIYAVESFLANLRRRKCVYHVVFFEDHAKVCVPPTAADEDTTKYALSRGVLKRHLLNVDAARKERDEDTVYVFQSVTDAAFDEYLERKRPYFFMCHNGDDWQDLENSDDDVDGEVTEVRASEVTEGKASEAEMKAMTRRFMMKGYNVALINHVEFLDSKIFTIVLESQFHGTARLTTVTPSIPPKEPSEPLHEAIQGLTSTRERLTVAALSKLITDDSDVSSATGLATTYLLHLAYLNHLSLSQRDFRAPEEALNRALVESNLQAFLQAFLKHATGLLENENIYGETPDLYDFVDGRLILKLLMRKDEIPEEVKADFERLAAVVETVSGTKLEFDSAVRGLIEYEEEKEVEVPDKPSILPFSNPIFDPFLEPIKLYNDVVYEAEDDSSEGFREAYHWHNAAKPLIIRKRILPAVAVTQAVGKGQSANKSERRAAGRARRKDQTYLNQMTRYAQSLSGGVLTPEKIIADPTGTNQKRKLEKEKEKEASKGKQVGKQVGKKAPPADKKVSPADKKAAAAAEAKGGKKGAVAKPVKLSKADMIKQKNAEQKAGKGAEVLMKSWTGLWRDLEKIKDEEAIVTRLDEFLKKVQKAIPSKTAMATETHDGIFVEVETRLYKVMVLQTMWAKLARAGEKDKGYTTVANLFDEARKILTSAGNTVSVKKILQNVFAGLGINMPPSPPGALPDRRLSFQTKWTGKLAEDDLTLGMSSEEFQLCHFGPFMDRDMDSAPDDRVPFNPDGWQRKVLDELDSENSVFVVAPTSAGKTFISFHAMKKVLRADDNGILVYVAPTKALVNQIAAEVISRFSKDYHFRNAGNTVWAIHTRDYRMNNPGECQILITVPHILSIMLLSPVNAEKWAPRVRRIIFDEVHSIGNAEDGVIWEQLLLLAPCPMIALSATVGNPEEFSQWLEATQGSLGIKMSMVQHPHRYSDLRKFAYVPGKDDSYKNFKGLGKLSKFGAIDGAPGIETVHPVAALVNPSHGMPDDLSLEPRDCFTLYKVMKEVQNEEYPFPKDLDYKKWFGTTGAVIKKSDVILWEAELKSLLRKWMVQNDSPFMNVVRKLGGGRNLAEEKQLTDVSDDAGALADPDMPEKLADPEFVGDEETRETEEAKLTGEESYIDLDISKTTYLRDKTLPLLQSLHSANALPAILFSYDRTLCEYLCKHLCDQLKRAEDEWRKTDPKWKALVKQWEEYHARKNSKSGKFKRPKPQEGTSKAEQMRDEAENEGSMFESFNPEDPSIEFSFADFKKHSKAELDKDVSDLEYWDISPALVHAFKRGIGVHHAGMNRKYRQAVEMLFRKGYLRVVIATGTLSLGINMPCKTVVFAGDSVYLTALNYRQAAGRAGRRGFDLLGNVIFHGLSYDKVHRLISSRLPSLMGHFPISTSLVLRLFILLNNSNGSPHATTSIRSLLTQPRLVLGGESFREQVLHHLRFSIEYLRRQKLLSATGVPLNFAGITSHLYYEEVSAFAFHALLTSGYIGKICTDISKSQKDTQEVQDKLMLVLCHIFGRRPVGKRSGIKKLAPLPEDCLAVLHDQNAQTLKMYTNYVTTFAKEYCTTADHTLPYSNLSCGRTTSDEAAVAKTGIVARSAFVALSGHTDQFSSIDDLATSVRSGVFLEGASVPYLPDTHEPLNSYLYEFYKHGDLKRLTTEHRIRPGDRWFVLKDFSLIVAVIVAGLTCYIRDGPGAYYDPSRIGGEEEGGDVLAEDEDEAADGEPVDGVEGEEEVEEKREKVPEELVRILIAFRGLQKEFEEKFRAINA
ncbi:hypothetical protein EDC01DRAFT_472866 [Geopyxis carbonaria]|nr:hypothetical protein EDC01DRAFT_472866 [Geopyxis carbonaria]